MPIISSEHFEQRQVLQDYLSNQILIRILGPFHARSTLGFPHSVGATSIYGFVGRDLGNVWWGRMTSQLVKPTEAAEAPQTLIHCWRRPFQVPRRFRHTDFCSFSSTLPGELVHRRRIPETIKKSILIEIVETCFMREAIYSLLVWLNLPIAANPFSRSSSPPL